jgi:hypothetical protein
MKVSIAIFAVAAADERKVPPRRPEQRLNRLNQFSGEWLNDNLPDLPSKNAWIAKFETNANRMLIAFNRANCGFFDATLLPHGGPDPNPLLNPKMRPRNMDRKRRSTESDDDYESDDGSLLRYDKNDPKTGIRQITTGYRKWAQRFINECAGQRKNNYQVDRMRRWFNRLLKHYVETKL